MLGKVMRGALSSIRKPMPAQKAGKELFDKDADVVLRSGIEDLSKKDFYDNPEFDEFIKNSAAGGEIDLENLIDLVGADEVADSIITKLTDKDGLYQLNISEVKDLAKVYQQSDVSNQQIMGELMTGMLEGDFDAPASITGSARGLPND